MGIPCVELEICRFSGMREVWYGYGRSWRYGVFENSVVCSNATFGDPLPKVAKRCYYRSLQDAGVLPARLDFLDVIFNGGDLITVENARYTLEYISNGTRIRATTPYVAKLLPRLLVPDSQNSHKTYFQFLITDSLSNPVSYNVFVAATDERCLVQQVRSALAMDFTFGRLMEIYSLVSNPVAGQLPLRSDTQRICTADSGKLAFFFKPPSVDAFQIKVVSHEHGNHATDVMDLFVPTKPVYAVR